MVEHRKALRALAGFGLGTLVCMALASAQQPEQKTSLGTVRKILGQGEGTAGSLSAESESADPDARSYWLHLPPSYDGKTPLPLVIALHPRGSNGARFERVSGFSQKADAANFIVVYPSASNNPRTWNAGYLSGQNNNEDVVFLEGMLDELQATLKIDPKRVYLAGLNGGAMMAYWAGTMMADRIAAIGVVSGAVGVTRSTGEIAKLPTPKQPVSVLAIHGQHNRLVPYKHGFSLYSHRKFLPVAETVKFWTEANACPQMEPKFDAIVMTHGPKMTAADIKREIYETEHQSRVKVFREVYGPCAGGTEFVLISMVDGNHKWPGAQELLFRGTLTPKEIKATDLMWEFFSKHAKP